MAQCGFVSGNLPQHEVGARIQSSQHASTRQRRRGGASVTMGLNRREFLLASGSVFTSWLLPNSSPTGSPLAAWAAAATTAAEASVEYSLPPLPYPYKALEPFIDEKTMQLHHDKHFKAYTDKLNAAIAKTNKISQPSIEQLEAVLKDLDGITDPKIKSIIRNNGGGYYNHKIFFETMSGAAGGKTEERRPTGKLAEEIDTAFGSFDEFKKSFTEAATGQFGSGWAWLYRDGRTGRLAVKAYSNQDSPRMEGHQPILGCDVWEHAYYLKYNNRRPEYVQAWWNVVNWDAVAARA